MDVPLDLVEYTHPSKKALKKRGVYGDSKRLCNSCGKSTPGNSSVPDTDYKLDVLLLNQLPVFQEFLIGDLHTAKNKSENCTEDLPLLLGEITMYLGKEESPLHIYYKGLLGEAHKKNGRIFNLAKNPDNIKYGIKIDTHYIENRQNPVGLDLDYTNTPWLDVRVVERFNRLHMTSHHKGKKFIETDNIPTKEHSNQSYYTDKVMDIGTEERVNKIFDSLKEGACKNKFKVIGTHGDFMEEFFKKYLDEYFVDPFIATLKGTEIEQIKQSLEQLNTYKQSEDIIRAKSLFKYINKRVDKIESDEAAAAKAAAAKGTKSFGLFSRKKTPLAQVHKKKAQEIFKHFEKYKGSQYLFGNFEGLLVVTTKKTTNGDDVINITCKKVHIINSEDKDSTFVNGHSILYDRLVNEISDLVDGITDFGIHLLVRHCPACHNINIYKFTQKYYKRGMYSSCIANKKNQIIICDKVAPHIRDVYENIVIPKQEQGFMMEFESSSLLRAIVTTYLLYYYTLNHINVSMEDGDKFLTFKVPKEPLGIVDQLYDPSDESQPLSSTHSQGETEKKGVLAPLIGVFTSHSDEESSAPTSTRDDSIDTYFLRIDKVIEDAPDLGEEKSDIVSLYKSLSSETPEEIETSKTRFRTGLIGLAGDINSSKKNQHY